ncbi:MAG: T9SS type A sorting domain-containing protein [Bacteroidota bacterium]
MKRILFLTFSVLIITSAYVFAQIEKKVHIYVYNDGTNSIDVKVERIENTIAAGSVNYFCWDICYTPGVSISPDPVTIAPGDTCTKFYAVYELHGTTDTSDITYAFFRSGKSTADTVYVNVIFSPNSIPSDTFYISIGILSTIGEGSAFSDKNKVSNSHPNPANAFFSLNYSLKADTKHASIIIRDMLGSVVKETRLQGKQGKVIYQTSGLKTGIYFYSLVVDGKICSTRKIVVGH